MIFAWLSGAFTITNINEPLWAHLHDILALACVFFTFFVLFATIIFYFENFLFVIYSLVWKPMSGKKNIQYCFNDGHSFIILAWIKSIIRFKYVIVYVCATNGLVECIFIVYFFFSFRAFVWNFSILFKIIPWNKKNRDSCILRYYAHKIIWITDI